MRRFIGVLRFDAITTFEEFQKIVTALLETGVNIAIKKDPTGGRPDFNNWQIVLTSKEEKE